LFLDAISSSSLGQSGISDDMPTVDGEERRVVVVAGRRVMVAVATEEERRVRVGERWAPSLPGRSGPGSVMFSWVVPFLGHALGGFCRPAVPHRLDVKRAGPGRPASGSDSPSIAHVLVPRQARPMAPRVMPCSFRAS
jgi:hypothetical protein